MSNPASPSRSPDTPQQSPSPPWPPTTPTPGPSASPDRSPTPPLRSPTRSAGELRRSPTEGSLSPLASPNTPQRSPDAKPAVSLDLDDVSEGSFSDVAPRRIRRSPHSYTTQEQQESEVEEKESDEDDVSDLQQKFAPVIPKLTRKDSQHLAILKLPPVVEMHSRPYERSTFEPTDSAAILYRLKPGVTEDDLVDVAMNCEVDVDEILNDLIDSNTNIVTWSDGSQTLVIGNESYDFVTNEAHDVSQHVFTRHADIQQAIGVIDKQIRIQPSTISGSRVRVTAQVKTPVKRQVVFKEVTQAPDIEEKIRAKNAQRAAREHARLAAKRRAVAQRTMVRARTSGLSVSYMEDASDADMSSRYERERERRRERDAAKMSRLMEVKREPHAREEVRVKRRRIGKHRIEDDEESEASEGSDESDAEE